MKMEGETLACDVDRSRPYLRRSHATYTQEIDALDRGLRSIARRERRELYSLRYSDDPHPATTPATLAAIPEACGFTAADRARQRSCRIGHPARAELPGSGNELHPHCWTAHSTPYGGFHTSPPHHALCDRSQGEFEFKPNFSYFDGESCDEDYLGWEQEVDSYFSNTDFPQDRQVRYVTRKLTGRAGAWWMHLTQARRHEGRRDVKTWHKMKRLLRGQFLTLDFEILLDHQQHTCSQIFHSMNMLDGCKQPEGVRKTNKDAHTHAHTHVDEVSSIFGGEPGSAAAIGHEYFRWQKKKYATITESPKDLKHRILPISTLTADVSDKHLLLSKGGRAAVSQIASDLTRGPQKPRLTTTYNTLIDLYGKAGRLKDASDTFLQMLQSGVMPDTLTFNTMINIGYSHCHLLEAESLLGKMEERKVHPGTKTFNIFMTYYSSHGDADNVLRCYRKMKQYGLHPDVVSFRIILQTLCERKMISEVEFVIEEIMELGSTVDEQLISFISRVDTMSKIVEPDIHIVESLLNDGKETSRPSFESGVLEGRKTVVDQETVELHSKQILMEKQASDDVDEFERRIRKGKTPSPIWDRLVFNKIKVKLGGRFRIMSSGASPLSPDIMEFLRGCFGCQIIEGYGMTETSCTITTIKEGNTLTGHVGSPISYCEIKLVDVTEMNYTSVDPPYPRGEIGVRGPIVFMGYYKDDMQTKEIVDEDVWLLTVDLIEGSNLAAVHSSGCYVPYIVFTCHGKIKTSSIKFHTLDPHWNDIFEFDAMNDPSSLRGIRVFDFNGPFHEASSLGHAEINFLQPNTNKFLMLLPTCTHGGLMEQGQQNFDVFLIKSGASKLGERAFPPKPGW